LVDGQLIRNNFRYKGRGEVDERKIRRQHEGHYIMFQIPTILHYLLDQDTDPIVYANCICNKIQAVSSRLLDVGSHKLSPSYVGIYTMVMNDLKIPNLKHSYESELDIIDKYKGAKREKIRKGFDRLVNGPLNNNDKRVPIFIKGEVAIPASGGGILKLKAPRVIFNIPECFASVGALLYSEIEFTLKKTRTFCDMVGSKFRVILKGFNSTEKAKLIKCKVDSFLHPIAISLDGKGCDTHLSEFAITIQEMVDYKISSQKSNLKKLYKLLHSANWKLYLDEIILILTEVMRLTGSIDTGMGNTVIHTIILIYIIRQVGFRVEPSVDGDNMLVIMEEENENEFMEVVKLVTTELGVSFTLDGKTTVLEEMEFCRHRPMHIGDQWVMVREPRRTIYKFFSYHSTFGLKQLNAYMKTVADGERRSFSGVPIMGPLFEEIYRQNIDEPEFKGQNLIEKHKIKDYRPLGIKIELANRLSFEKSTGISVASQMHIECNIKDAVFKYTWGENLSSPWLFNDQGFQWDPSYTYIRNFGR